MAPPARTAAPAGAALWPEEDDAPAVASLFADVFDAPAVARVEHSAYVEDPIGWIRDVLGVPEHTMRWALSDPALYATHAWDGTPEPIVAICEGLLEWAKGIAAQETLGPERAHEVEVKRIVAVESATGVGKTFIAAALCLWFLACHEDSFVITVANSERQLEKGVWKEVGAFWPAFKRACPLAKLTHLRIQMDPGRGDKWSMYGAGTAVKAGETTATGIAGNHAEHMLILVDEAPGVPPAILEALDKTCSAPHNLQVYLGNPQHQQDALHIVSQQYGTHHVRISGHDHPNVVCNDASIIPGAKSRAQLEKARRVEGEDSRLYQAMQRGICPAEAAESMIKWAWCRDAVSRGRDAAQAQALAAQGGPALGVDVAASTNGDLGAIARGRGALAEEVTAFPCPDPVALGVRVAAEMGAGGIPPERVGVDGTGVGAGTIGRLREAGKRVQNLLGAASVVFVSGQMEVFANLRAQMWWRLRTDLQQGKIALPDDEELLRDITAVQWTTRNGKILVESKEDIRKRLGRSPNKGDALCYWNWTRQTGGPSIAPATRKSPARITRW